MFERFTPRARQVVVLSQEQARLLNHNHIGTEHLLLALSAEEEAHSLAAAALNRAGIALDSVRAQVVESVGEGGSPPSGHVPFTPGDQAGEATRRPALLAAAARRLS